MLPYFNHLKQMYEPQYICEKYFLILLILQKLDNSGVELIQQERRHSTRLVSCIYFLLSTKMTLKDRSLSGSFLFSRVFLIFDRNVCFMNLQVSLRTFQDNAFITKDPYF